MGFKELHKDEASYAEAKAKAYKAVQENRKIINNREHFTLALYESTSEVFKPLTNNQDKSLKEKQNIVKEISDLSRHSPCIEFSCIMYFMYKRFKPQVCIVMY